MKNLRTFEQFEEETIIVENYGADLDETFETAIAVLEAIDEDTEVSFSDTELESIEEMYSLIESCDDNEILEDLEFTETLEEGKIAPVIKAAKNSVIKATKDLAGKVAKSKTGIKVGKGLQTARKATTDKISSIRKSATDKIDKLKAGAAPKLDKARDAMAKNKIMIALNKGIAAIKTWMNNAIKAVKDAYTKVTDKFAKTATKVKETKVGTGTTRYTTA